MSTLLLLYYLLFRKCRLDLVGRSMLDLSTERTFSLWKFSTLSTWLFDGTCTKQSFSFIELHHQIYFTFVWNLCIDKRVHSVTSVHTKATILSFSIQIGLNRSFVVSRQASAEQTKQLPATQCIALCFSSNTIHFNLQNNNEVPYTRRLLWEQDLKLSDCVWCN